MEQIKCPKCGEVFTIDESSYSSIVKQIRDKEFDRQIKEKEEQFNKEKNYEVEHVKSEVEKVFREELFAKSAEIDKLKQEAKRLKSDTEKEYRGVLDTKDVEIERLKLEAKQVKSDAEKEFRDEIVTKNVEIERLKLEAKQVKSDAEKEFRDEIATKNVEIEKLKLEVQQAIKDVKTEKERLSLQAKFALDNEINKRDKEIQDLKNELANLHRDKELALNYAYTEKDREIAEMEKEYERQIKLKEEELSYYKDYKAKQSVKLLGETLEQHCEVEFNRFRALGFQNSYFEKDNQIVAGSKGDYIFRDFDVDNTEIISIMFEMKNEADKTATKRKNEDFFKELDKDRKAKECEYAVLVSLLEQDNELYNSGIVDVSHKYPKMYVIRPQFFIPLITLLRNASLKSLEYKKALQVEREQNIDLANFEQNMEEFKKGFAKNYRLASEKFGKAIDGIDDTIEKLQKIKKALLGSENDLRLANQKAEELSIKKLTKNCPAVAAMFEELKND